MFLPAALVVLAFSQKQHYWWWNQLLFFRYLALGSLSLYASCMWRGEFRIALGEMFMSAVITLKGVSVRLVKDTSAFHSPFAFIYKWIHCVLPRKPSTMRILSFLPLYPALVTAAHSPRQPSYGNHPNPRVPTIWLAGDSTEAPKGGGNGTQGWGQYLQYSFLPSVALVNNSAIAGRSARSFTREGRFDTIASNVKEGDWVVIEFGHNDGGTPPVNATVGDKGRADCPGAG